MTASIHDRCQFVLHEFIEGGGKPVAWLMGAGQVTQMMRECRSEMRWQTGAPNGVLTYDGLPVYMLFGLSGVSVLDYHGMSRLRNVVKPA